MPDFPIVDTHLHLWDPQHLRYPWLATVPPLNRPHLLADFRAHCGEVQVAKMVFVQCECDPLQSVDEVEWVSGLAQQDPRIRGLVGHASLERNMAETELASFAANPLARGIRRLLQSEDDDFCLRAAFVRGVQRLPRHGLTFDLCIFHRQLANVIELVRQCPNVRFVLDHIGKPNIRSQQFEPWRTQLRQLASFENVACKLSGLATEADFKAWTPADLQPYIDHVVDCFGFDRVMFGGDWPVSTQATTYPRWVKTLDAALRGCSPDELHRVYVRNAESFYRI